MFFIVIGMEVMEYIEKGRLSSVPKAIMLLISLAVLFVSTFISKIDSAEKENLKAALERENIYFDSDKRAKKLFYRGIRGYYSGNFSVAYYYLQKAAEKAKGPEAAARAYCYIGRSAIAEKKYTRAVQSLKKSTELDRGYSIAWNNLAGAYHLINEKEKFRQACETGLLYCPADASLNSKLGRYYFDITEYEKAFDCFKKAERIDASNAVFTMNTALTYAALGDRENAEINFNKAKKRDIPTATMHTDI